MSPPSPADAAAIERGRHLVELFAAGKLAEATATFDDTMKGALPEAKLAATWQGLITGAGPLDGIDGARVEVLGAYRSVVVTCRFQRARIDAKIAYDGKDRVAGLFFAPTPSDYTDPPYVDRTTFDEREATVGSGEWALPGTVSVPKGAGPFPAVVLVHGSGPNDRDESIGANRVFKDLAGGLASRGVAVLRYDKRTKVHAKKLTDLSGFTVDHETVDDALAAVETLRGVAAVDGARVVVAGHSLGGQLAPRIASRGPHVRAIAILAGSTRGVDEMMIEQMTYIAGLDGRRAPEEDAQITGVKAASARIRAVVGGAPAKEGEVLLGAGAAYWIDLAKYDCLAAAKGLAKPIFVAQGGRDYQVTTVDFERWKAALAGRSDVETKLYPELNHIFGAGAGKSAPEEYQRRSVVDPRLVDDLAAWVKKLSP